MFLTAYECSVYRHLVIWGLSWVFFTCLFLQESSNLIKLGTQLYWTLLQKISNEQKISSSTSGFREYIMTLRLKLKFRYYEKSKKSFFYEILFSARSLKIFFSPFDTQMQSFPVIWNSGFWKKSWNISKIYKNYSKLFLVRNDLEWHPWISDTPLSLFFGLNKWQPSYHLFLNSIQNSFMILKKFAIF